MVRIHRATIIVAFSVLPIAAQAQIGGDEGLYRAAYEINMVILFFRVLMAVFGLYAIGWGVLSLVRFYSQQSPGGDGKTFSGYLVAIFLGVILLSYAFSISILTNTSFGSANSGAMDVVYNLSSNPAQLQNFVNGSTYITEVGDRSRFPVGVIKVIFMMTMAAGVVATYRGARIWWVALTSGSEMGGTSIGHKTSSIMWHILGGIALINLDKTLQALSATAAALLSAVL